jgi:hypothetical protein
MTDVIMVAIILAFFLAAAQLVRLCGHITAAAEDLAPEVPPSEAPLPDASPTRSGPTRSGPARSEVR